MDCLTYRRTRLATPQDASQEIIAHAQQCLECAAFTRQLDAFEQDLHTTLQFLYQRALQRKFFFAVADHSGSGLRGFQSLRRMLLP